MVCICGHDIERHVELKNGGRSICKAEDCVCAMFGSGRDHKEEEKILFEGNATRSKKPRYALIPKSAIDALAGRLELGEEKHKDKSWNALSENRETALTKEWVRAGLEHIIGHAFIALQKLNGVILDDGDDDAGAILFGGAVLVEYNRLQKEKK